MFNDDVTPLLRTEFGDDAAWERVVAAFSGPVGFDGAEDGDDVPSIAPISDPSFAGVTGDALASAWTGDSSGYVLLADARAMANLHDVTVTYVDLREEPGRSFRCAIGEVASIEANLWIANMAFEEFAENVGPDGVFRGFPA